MQVRKAYGAQRISTTHLEVTDTSGINEAVGFQTYQVVL